MNIYQDDPEASGVIDIEKAARELKRTDGMSPDMRRAAVAEISAGALLDIASSLRPIAAEALAAMAEQDDYPHGHPELDPEPEALIAAGDIVHVSGLDEIGEVTATGVDQDAAWAVVRLDAPDDGSEPRIVRVWADRLTRLRGDEGGGPIEAVQYVAPEGGTDGPFLTIGARVYSEAERVQGVIEGFEQGEGGAYARLDVPGAAVDHVVPIRDLKLGEPPHETAEGHAADLLDAIEPHDAAVVAEEIAEEIDDDFDGDEHADAAAALERLKANEAARKAAKKSSSKKGKKS